MSLREAGRRLGLNSHYVKGLADALGIHLTDAPPSLLMSFEDFCRLRDHYAAIQEKREIEALASA